MGQNHWFIKQNDWLTGQNHWFTKQNYWFTKQNHFLLSKTIDLPGKIIDSLSRTVDLLGKTIVLLSKTTFLLSKTIDLLGKTIDSPRKKVDLLSKTIFLFSKTIDLLSKILLPRKKGTIIVEKQQTSTNLHGVGSVVGGAVTSESLKSMSLYRFAWFRMWGGGSGGPGIIEHPCNCNGKKQWFGNKLPSIFRWFPDCFLDRGGLCRVVRGNSSTGNSLDKP